jgi:hypothetical protein
MKRSRVVLLVVVISVLLLLVLPTTIASATVAGQVYFNDFSGWQRAAGPYAIENFNDPGLNPNLSVVSDAGYLDTYNGWWYDQIWASPRQTTTWYFSHPITAWGCWYGLGYIGPPQLCMVDVWMSGSWVPMGTMPLVFPGQRAFWGVVTHQPFTAVRLSGGNLKGPFDDMVWNYVVYYPGFIGKGGMRPGCFGLTP